MSLDTFAKGFWDRSFHPIPLPRVLHRVSHEDRGVLRSLVCFPGVTEVP